MQKAYAYVVSVVVLAAVGWPAFGDFRDDDYPLSTYPMFARPRARVADVTSALAIQASGASEPVPPSYIANAEAMQAVATLRATVAQGPAASRALCDAIASRIGSSNDAELRAAVRVELVTGRVDTIDFLGGRATPRARRLHARCDVPGQLP